MDGLEMDYWNPDEGTNIKYLFLNIYIISCELNFKLLQLQFIESKIYANRKVIHLQV